MGRIVVSENVSLDGVVQDPTGDEGFERGGWFNRMEDQDRQAWVKIALEEALSAEALLFGRRSYEFFAVRWPTRSGPLADRLNSMPKYVVSSSLVDPKWNNTTVIAFGIEDQVSRLRQKLNGDILVLASFQLVQTLVMHHLADELRLIIFPSVLGAGKRLFDNVSAVISLHLIKSYPVGESLVKLEYAFHS